MVASGLGCGIGICSMPRLIVNVEDKLVSTFSTGEQRLIKLQYTSPQPCVSHSLATGGISVRKW